MQLLNRLNFHHLSRLDFKLDFKLTDWIFIIQPLNREVRNSRITKSSYEIELRKMMSHFELLTQKFLEKFSFRVTNSTS